MMTLQDERDYWHAYAKQLEAALAPVDELPFIIRRLLTKSQAKMLSALMASAGVVHHERMRLAIYGDREPVEHCYTCVAIWISRIRRTLRPFGIEIITHMSIGYELAPASRDIIKHLKQQDAARWVA